MVESISEHTEPVIFLPFHDTIANRVMSQYLTFQSRSFIDNTVILIMVLRTTVKMTNPHIIWPCLQVIQTFFVNGMGGHHVFWTLFVNLST